MFEIPLAKSVTSCLPSLKIRQASFEFCFRAGNLPTADAGAKGAQGGLREHALCGEYRLPACRAAKSLTRRLFEKQR